MAAPMAANFAAAADPQAPAEPYMQQQQYHHQQQQQEQQPQYQQQYQQEESHPPPPPTRQTSFGLPSIPRTTSFGWGSKKSPTEENRRIPSPEAISNDKNLPPPPQTESDTSGEEAAFGPDSRGASPVNNFPQPPSGRQQQQQQPYYGHISAQAPSSAQPAHSMSHHIAGQIAPNSQPMNGYGPGPSQQAANGFDGSAADANRNSPRIPSSSQLPAIGRGSPSLSQPGQMPRHGSSPPMPGQAFMPSLRPGGPGGVMPGNPVSQLPPSPRWNLQESQLSEPLVSSRKTQSPQPGYYAYDKEMGLESQVNNAPPQPLQRTTRNMGLPPVSAQKYPGLFPGGTSNPPPSQSPPVPQDQLQVTPVIRQDSAAFSKPAAANEFQPGDDSHLRRNPSLSKEMGGSKFNGRGSTDGAAGSIRGDDISESSDVLGFESREQPRRDSLQVPRNQPAINGNQSQPPSQQPTQHFRSVSEQVGGGNSHVEPHEEKKKKIPFFGGAKKQPSFSVISSDPSGAKNDPQPGKEHGRIGTRKRLSELKGIFKNNEHDEDQPAKPSGPQQAQAQAGRPSMSDPPQQPQQGSQAPLWHQQPVGRPGQMGPGPGPGPSPLAGGGRLSMQGASRPPAPGVQPNAMQPVSNGDDGSKKPGGFLGFLNNRPGSKSHGHPALSGQPMPPQGQPSPPSGQQQFRQPGPDGPPFDTRMTGVGQVTVPQQQRSPPLAQGQDSPGFVTMPLQANQRPKIVTVKSGSPNRPRGPSLLGQGGGVNAQQPRQEVVAPDRQGAVSPLHQASRDDRPSLPSQQNSFTQEQPGGDRIWERPTGAAIAAASKLASETSRDPTVAASPPLSRKSSEERISIGGASMAPRNTPTRKPVGSGPSRDRAVSVSSVNPSTAPNTAQPSAPTSRFQHLKSDSSVTVEPVEEHPALNDQPSLTHLGEKGGFGHERQLSIPTPSAMSVAHTQSPISQDTANRSSGHSQQQLSPKPSTGFSVQAPNTAAFAATDRQKQPQPTGPQPGDNNASPGLAPPHKNPHAQTWGPEDVSRPGTIQSSAPQQQQPQQMQNQMRSQTGPAPSVQEQPKPEHQKSTMSKFFGGSKKQQAALQPSNSSAQAKEKEKTSNKLKSVFKRSSKVPESNQQQQQQQGPQGQQQQMPMHMMQGGRGGPGQPMPMGMQRPPMGPNGVPQGSIPGTGQPMGPMQAGLGRGQIPPQMMQQMQVAQNQKQMFLPGQIPPQMLHQMQQQAAARGQQLPPHMMAGMMAGRGQQPPQHQPPIGGARGQEPQYDQVPIPQGYQPVHGYGGTGAMAFSSYTYGQQFQGYQQPMQQQQFGPSPSNSPPSAQSPFGPAQPQFQGGMPAGMVLGPQQQQFAQAQGMPQVQSQASSHHSQTPPPQQPMMQGPPAQGLQQPGGPVQSSVEGQRRFISPENSQDIAQGDASSRVSSMSPQNEGGLPKPNLQHIATTMGSPQQQQQQQQQPNPHIQHPGSPQNYPLPDSAATFSPVNPAAGRLPNPPAPMAESVHGSEPATDKGNISDISHTPSPRSGMNGPGVAMTHNIPISDEHMRSASLSPDPSRAPHHQASNHSLNINVGKANSQSSDTEDIYDATPRKMRSPNEHPSENRNNHAGVMGAAAVGGAVMGGTALGITAGVTPPQNDSAHVGGYFVQRPNGGNYDASSGGTPSVATESATPYEHPAGAQPQQQQQVHAEPEEKILVDQPVELAAAPDDLDDGMPVMSATSYPGQEWNPYGYGEFGDFEA